MLRMKSALARRALLSAAVALMAFLGMAQTPSPVKSPRLYIFDCGMIRGLDPGLFQFKKEDLASTDMVVPCYMVVHPKGVLVWDTGVIPDSAFKPGGAPVSQPLPWRRSSRRRERSYGSSTTRLRRTS